MKSLMLFVSAVIDSFQTGENVLQLQVEPNTILILYYIKIIILGYVGFV